MIESLLFNFGKCLFSILLNSIYSIRHRGVSNVPQSGPAIIVSNHPTYLDPILLCMRVPRLIRFVTWDALFKVPIISFFIKKYQAIPVNLAKFEIASWRKMISALRSGHLLGIFPEGGRTRGDLLDEFKSGFIKVALKETIPIIPVTIKGTREIWHISWVFPRLSGSIEVIFSKPVDISALNANNEDAIELLTRRIREAMLANL